MSDLKHKCEERLSRQRAAERLTGFAHVMCKGRPLKGSSR
jgi:hypothetical protein